MSRPADPAAGLRSQLVKVRLLLGTQLRREQRALRGALLDLERPQETALARGSSAALPKRGFAVRVGTRAPQGRAMAAHWAHTPARQRTRFDSGPCNGDNARCDAALIRPAAVVRVHVSPLRDRLAVGQLRFERRKRAFESCARNPRGTRRLVTAAGLHPAEKSSILLSRTARSHTARGSGGSAEPDKLERQSSTLWCCTNAR